MRHPSVRFPGSLLIACLMLATAMPAQDGAGLETFEKTIRPLLIKRCYACHSSEAESL
jgi:hypothetical protein